MGIGGIGSITSSNNMSLTQVSSSDLKDQKSKSLQNDITDIERQMQRLSSDEELTVTEKAEERKKLKQEESDLSTKLKLHQEELLKSQKKEIKLAELQEEQKPEEEEASEDGVQAVGASTPSDTADEKKLPADDRHSLQPGTIITQNSDGTVILKEILGQAAERDTKTQNAQTETPKAQAEKQNARTETLKEEAAEKEKKAAEDESDTETGLTGSEVQAMVSADSVMQQADRQGSLVTKTNGDIAVLQGEIKLDASRGTDTEGKQAELKEMQEHRKQEMAFQFSLLGEANQTMPATMDANASANGAASNATERTFHVSGVNASPEEQALQQGMQVSIA